MTVLIALYESHYGVTDDPNVYIAKGKTVKKAFNRAIEGLYPDCGITYSNHLETLFCEICGDIEINYATSIDRVFEMPVPNYKKNGEYRIIHKNYCEMREALPC